MVNISYIQTALQGLIGFKQPFNPEYAIVDAENQLSESGYYVTDNSYAKVEYIKDNQDYLGISDIDFNLLLKGIVSSSISSVINQVFIESDFIDRDLMFKHSSNKQEVVTLPNGFVGYEIEISKERNKSFSINRVLLDFEGTGDIELILWNTSSKTPLFTKTITIVKDHQEELLNWTLNNTDTTFKGEYYIGYLTDGLTVSPYKRQYDDANVMTEFINLEIERVFVKNHNSQTLFDLSLEEGMYDDIGLNFDISVYDDFTDFIINNKRLFARAIQLESIIYCIQMYMASLRNNGNNIESKILYEKMMIDLEGVATNRSITVKGLKNKLVTEITMIRAEVEKLIKGFSKKGQIFITTMT